jgi:quinol monooxygenase YgiN
MYRFVVGIKVKPGSLPVILAAAKPLIAATRTEPGNLAYDLYVDSQSSDSIMFVESFKDHAAHRAHESTKHFLDFAAVARPLFLEAKLEPILDDEA